MRGLPDVPPEVALLELYYQIDGTPATTWHWIFDDGLQVLTPADFETLWASIIFAALNPVLDLMASAGSVVRARLRRWGSAPLEVIDAPAANHGVNGGCQVVMAASGIYWTTQFAGRGGRAYTRWPAFPDAFTDDHRTLNAIGYAQVGARSKDFRNAINGVTDPNGRPLRLVSLHRQSGGLPLDIAEPREIVGAVPLLRVAAVVRRARGLASI